MSGPKMSPELTMRAIVEESAKDAVEHVTSLEGEALDAELRDRGVEPEEAARRAEAAIAAALGITSTGGREPVEVPAAAASASSVVPLRGRAPRPAPPAPRSLLRRWMVAGPLAAAAAFAAVVGAMNAGAIATALRGGHEAIGPDPNVLPPPPPSAPEGPATSQAAVDTQAAALRSEALAACAKKEWSTCVVKLDRAQEIDPHGEELPEVIAARHQLKKVFPK